MYFITERINRIIKELKECIYPQSREIIHYKMKKGYFRGGESLDQDLSDWENYNTTLQWGGDIEEERHYWFRTEIIIPEEFCDKEVFYHITTGLDGDWDLANPQLLAYLDGEIVQGIDIRHREIVITKNAVPGRIYQLALQAYCGIRGGRVNMNSYITTFDREVEALYYHIKVPLDVVEYLDKEDIRRIDILTFLENAVNLLDLRRSHSKDFYDSLRRAYDYLNKEFYGKFCGREPVTALCVGHTHIDIAWLWTFKQTREKVARSFATVLSLMDEYPEYIFMSSQPQLYAYIKEDYPQIYAKMKSRIQENRWEAEGAMWLEADCNLISGESMVRQILFGKRFFKKEFGVESEILWLPDVFGYSAALPQILKKSGVKYFMTTKLGWNEYNGIPYDTFLWKGIDGSEVLTHMITTQDPKFNITPHATSYNGHIEPSNIIGAWKRYHQKDINKEVLVAYGYGDGGGGPTREMLENAKRLKHGIPGCPVVKMGNSLEFFRRLQEQVNGNKRLPKWVGELYLEYHRGTYTSMARNKRDNRKCEILYQNVEIFSLLAKAISRDFNYPKEDINKGWQTLLLNQFHDILPGSAIKEVYEDTKEGYLQIKSEGHKLLQVAMKDIISNIKIESMAIIIFNALSNERNDLARVKLGEEYIDYCVIDEQGIMLDKQIIKSSDNNNAEEYEMIFQAVRVPPKGYKTFYLKRECAGNVYGEQAVYPYITKNQLKNRFFDIILDENGNIISIFDQIEKRQLIKKDSKANIFQVFEDKPHNYDAWDINVYYQEKMWEILQTENVEVIEKGPVMASIRITKRFMESIIVQDITIYKEIPRIDFICHVDWKEKQMLLKVKFPLELYGDKATFDIQYGNVERATHKNTSWDFARFEVCAHKWVDISEDGYGISLLNDSKYGCDVNEGDIRLTLIKSAVDPNENADREIHEFTYSLYPHQGNWKNANTSARANELNNPLYCLIASPNDGKLAQQMTLGYTDCENVIIEVMKQAEDGEDCVIRLYESIGRRTRCLLKWHQTFKSIHECDLMENNLTLEGENQNFLEFEIKPYEIKTLKITK